MGFPPAFLQGRITKTKAVVTDHLAPLFKITVMTTIDQSKLLFNFTSQIQCVT